MNNILLDKCIAEIDTEIDKNSPGIWEEKPVSPKEFFKYWLRPQLSEPQLEVFNSLFKDNDWGKEYSEYVLNWGQGCLAGNTILKDEETGKEYTIKELAEKKVSITVKSLKVDCSDKIISTHGGTKHRKVVKKYKIVKVKTEIPFKKGYTKLYKVKTKVGKEIIVSGEHRFYTKEGWKELKDLKINDKIAINTNTIRDIKVEK